MSLRSVIHRLKTCTVRFLTDQYSTKPVADQVDHTAGAYLGFYSMKRLGIFLLLPGWDANPS